MKIGIIGAGAIGGNLARSLSRLGHDITIANSRGPETLTALVQEIGVTAGNLEKTVERAELVIVTIPLKAVADLPKGLLQGAQADAPVIDTNNYYPQRDGRIGGIEDDGLTESEWVAQQLDHPVVKAFNNIYAAHILSLATPPGDPDRVGLPVAGSDPQKRVVSELVGQMGFDAVDAGSLADSWRQQPGTPVYGADLDAQGVRQGLSEARPERPTAFQG